jgi:hypothetical protein
MSKYFELFGDVRKKVLQVFDKQSDAIKEAQKLAKELNADEFVYSTGFVCRVMGFKFTKRKAPADDDKRLRKKYDRHTKQYVDWYVPNKRSKEGKELDKRISKMFIPGQSDVGSILKLKDFSLPGVRRYGKGSRQRVIVEVPDNFKPTKKDAKDYKRISDVDVEKLSKRRRPVKKKVKR